ncbi:MAG: DUF4912 domain-containing protein [Candidatus Eisenbacteria bacterium]|nr:DUF4912 domain-containing protein [Candidatus Eisenbacteria bacterium]
MKKNELTKKTVAELREMAGRLGLTGISRLRKADLIAVIMNAAKKGSRAKPSATKRKGAGGASSRVVRKSDAKRAAPKKTGRTSRTKKRTGKTAAKKPSGSSSLSPRTSKAFAAFRERGDQRVRASKYYLAPHETPELDSDFEFPATYGQNRIALMVRDPYWLFSYWEFRPDLEAELVERLGRETVENSRLILRVYDVTGTDPESADGWHDIEVAGGARNWYINVMRVEREYCVDIGLLTPDGEFILIARSNRVSLPPVGPSDVVDEEWVVVEALDELYRDTGPGGPTSGSGGWGSGGLRD